MKLVAMVVAFLAFGCVGGINLEADPVDDDVSGSDSTEPVDSSDDPLERCNVNCIASCARVDLPFGVCYPSDDRFICRCYRTEPTP
jgi:hypothetical protein